MNKLLRNLTPFRQHVLLLYLNRKQNNFRTQNDVIMKTAHYFNLSTVFKNTFLFTKMFMMQIDFSSIKNTDTFTLAPPIISDNVKNLLFHSVQLW
jgi:hypothetical protein